MRADRRKRIWLAFAGLTFALCPTALAQQVTIGTPMQRINDSFYENFGFNWGFRSSGPGGLYFNSGGPNQAVPPFGNFNPAGQAGFGFGGNGFGFNFSAGSGSDRSIISETPFITIPNGGFGVLSNSSVRPFVTGVIPVVGDRPRTPLDEKLHRLRTEGVPAVPSPSTNEYDATVEPPLRLGQSSAERADVSIAEIRRQQADEDQQLASEVAELISSAQTAEAAGKQAVARIYYEQAARRATGSLRDRLEQKIAELRTNAGAP